MMLNRLPRDSLYLVAKFLFNLGLRRLPPLDVLLGLAAGDDSKIRGLALRYYLDNANTKYANFSPLSYSHLAFVPAFKDKQAYMAKPNEVSLESSTLDEVRQSYSPLNPRCLPTRCGLTWVLPLFHRPSPGKTSRNYISRIILQLRH